MYVYLTTRQRGPVPPNHSENLPHVTMKLPIYNDVYAAGRLLRSANVVAYARERQETGRCHSGRFFKCSGTAGLWRRSCIEQSGGCQADTLCEVLDLSYRAQLAGWKFIYLADVVTPAELPVDMNGFKSQQHRWTKGSVQTCKKLLPTIWR